jgi:hypothetical protein
MDLEWLDADPSLFPAENPPTAAEPPRPPRSARRTAPAILVALALVAAVASAHPWRARGATVFPDPAERDANGSLVATARSAFSLTTFRLRLDDTGVGLCETTVNAHAAEPTTFCEDSRTLHLPVLATWVTSGHRWVWALLPSAQAAAPELWVRQGDGSVDVVPLIAHGAVAWPSAAAALRGDERSVELHNAGHIADSVAP